jgi:hypothetical protein
MSNAIADVALQYLVLYTMVCTVHHAARNGYYRVGTRQSSSMAETANHFYTGALYSQIAGSVALLSMTLAIVYFMHDIHKGRRITLGERCTASSLSF